ncbi:MAG: DNA mismatch repair endonuclease MutL [Deltaproteobacteria bacterium]|nr:DNA mismatch repair endonuclease MutL [Deltaproteobacteria bacterium]
MIRKLSPHLVHQIAAGEVIERPASVLKELIENALDAGASQIDITYENGGLKSLSVEDNGKGISEEELMLAFEAHATSKISQFDDFEKLQTFGFRGEALSSISAMADLEIWTSCEKEKRGSRGRVAFGAKKKSEAADKRIGTKVQMRDLFSAHPARLKFMKSERGEAMQLLSVFKKYSLAYPEFSFSIKDLETEREHSTHSESFLDRVIWFFGDSEKDHWLQVNAQSADWKMQAVILRPRFQQKVRAGIHLFLNRRPFKDSRLEFAVKRAFEGFTLFTRDIAAVIFLEGSPKLFDVNVHPMKTEVRFLQADTLFSFISKNITEALRSEHLEIQNTKSEVSLKEPEVFSSPSLETDPNRSSRLWDLRPGTSSGSQPLAGQRESLAENAEEKSAVLFEHKSEFEFIDVLDDTYLLVRKNSELYIFDQHALHERILYERLLADFSKLEKIPSQRLLFPQPIPFSGAENLLEHEELLEKLGFEIRQWSKAGENKNQMQSIQLVAAPAILKRGHSEVLSKISESTSRGKETVIRDVLASMACHSAVRAHDRIDTAEIDRLLKDFQSEDALGHCPHGRPTFVRLQIKDLEKMFQRVV